MKTLPHVVSRLLDVEPHRGCRECGHGRTHDFTVMLPKLGYLFGIEFPAQTLETYFARVELRWVKSFTVADRNFDNNPLPPDRIWRLSPGGFGFNLMQPNADLALIFTARSKAIDAAGVTIGDLVRIVVPYNLMLQSEYTC